MRRPGSWRNVWSGFVTRLVVCPIELGMRVVPHALLHRGIYVTLPQEQCISFGVLNFVRVCLDVLSNVIERWLFPQTKDGLVTHLLLHAIIHLLCRSKSGANPATLTS